ncbi:MAG: hypothetical protein HQ513_17460 [Rhodospirillales bacterium]|nr:hypothetical protein [Rhodospirillales bacterium]
MSPKWPINERKIIAEQLRRYTDISRARKERNSDGTSKTSEDSFDEQKQLFIQSEFLDYEYQALELKVIDAAKQGKYEVEVIKFPAAYCTDRGRAINNSEKDWPETLQGKARSFLTIWKEHGQPIGFRLKVKINNYPGGFIGDVSLFIDWS